MLNAWEYSLLSGVIASKPNRGWLTSKYKNAQRTGKMIMTTNTTHTCMFVSHQDKPMTSDLFNELMLPMELVIDTMEQHS